MKLNTILDTHGEAPGVPPEFVRLAGLRGRPPVFLDAAWALAKRFKQVPRIQDVKAFLRREEEEMRRNALISNPGGPKAVEEPTMTTTEAPKLSCTEDQCVPPTWIQKRNALYKSTSTTTTTEEPISSGCNTTPPPWVLEGKDGPEEEE